MYIQSMFENSNETEYYDKKVFEKLCHKSIYIIFYS